MCVRVLRGTVLLILYVRARSCVWRKEGLRRTVTFDLASEGWQGLGAPVACFTKTIFSDLKQAHTDCQPASWWLVPCFFFYYLFFTFAVKFHRRMKSFFFLLCDILKAGFSFCSLGETANALDEMQKSLARSLYGWLFDKFILPCLPVLHQIYTVYLKKSNDLI